MIPTIVLLLFVLVLLGLGYWIAEGVLYPSRQPLLRSPLTYGLPYEDVSFSSRYGLRLQGWWIPAPQPGHKAVVLLHPFGGNRCGLESVPAFYRPWQPVVDLLPLAQAFHAAGYAVLMFDFRSHGESERGLCAGGQTEDQDVAGAVDTAFQRLAANTSGSPPMVGVVGVGSGATALLTAVGREKGSAEVVRFFSGDSEGGSGFIEYRPPNVKRLAFLVAIEPASLATFLRRSLASLSPFLLPLVSWWCWQRGGYPLRSDYLPALVREIHIPILYIGACPGEGGENSEIHPLYEVTPAVKELLWLDGACKGSKRCTALPAHFQSILSFAEQYSGTLVLPA